ncbi:MAG: Trm112 family protein [Fibrobacterota bacterium]
MNNDLLDILCCPETKQELTLMERDELRKLNAKIREGAVTNVGGAVVRERLDNALLRKDGTLVYPVRRDIPILLVEEGIKL